VVIRNITKENINLLLRTTARFYSNIYKV